MKTRNDVQAEFEAELTRRGLTFSRREDGLYEVRRTAAEARGVRLTVSIQNLIRDVLRDDDPKAIGRFVDKFDRKVPADAGTWKDARPWLRLSIEPNNYEAEVVAEALQRPASPMTMLVLTLADAAGEGVRWVTAQDLERWGVSREDAELAARSGLDGLLVGNEPKVETIEGVKLGMIPVAPEYKASVIFAPQFRRFVEPSMGWPVLAVTPCRDFVYLFSDNGLELVKKASKVVLEEFDKSGYPVTTEVWRISDAGVEAIGSLRAPAPR